ncbi:MAG: hypothetical protein AAF675_08960 [Pseudomonadota bacterium]
MIIDGTTVHGTAMAFGLCLPEPAVAARIAANHGRLAEERLAHLVLDIRVLRAEPDLQHKLRETALSVCAAPATKRQNRGDVTAARAATLAQADRLAAILDGASTDLGMPPTDLALIAVDDPLAAFLDTIAPEEDA